MMEGNPMTFFSAVLPKLPYPLLALVALVTAKI